MPARGWKLKPYLLPEEELICAYMNIVVGIEQHHLASIFRVNSGRVNEGIQKVRQALEMRAPPPEEEPELDLGEVSITSTPPPALTDET